MKKKYNLKYLGIGALVISLLVISTFAFADTGTDTILVDITVSSVTYIDINPNSTSFTGNPGETSNANPLQLENIGSTNISTIDVNATNAASNPWATGSVSNYNAGDFVLLNKSTDGILYYINTKSWNETKPHYVTAPSGWTEGDSSGYFGRFRTVSLGQGPSGDTGEEYFWFTEGGGINCTNGSFYIATIPHTKTNTGTIDFSSASAITLTASSDGTYGVATIDQGASALQQYCVRVSADCSEVTIFKYNVAMDGPGACTNDKHLYDASGDESSLDYLLPGETFDIWMVAKIPFGVADGSVSTGTVTFIATGA